MTWWIFDKIGLCLKFEDAKVKTDTNEMLLINMLDKYSTKNRERIVLNNIRLWKGALCESELCNIVTNSKTNIEEEMHRKSKPKGILNAINIGFLTLLITWLVYRMVF